MSGITPFASKLRPSDPPVLAGKYVTLVGQYSLQNSMLAARIEAETGATCRVVATLPAPSVPADHLVLLDALGQDLQSVLAHLDMLPTAVAYQCNLAVLNVSSELWYDELATRPEVRGIFQENISFTHLIKGLSAIFDGQFWLPRELLSRHFREYRARQALSRPRPPELTAREMEVLRMVAGGASNAEIAERMCRSVHTVKTHIYHVFRKINVSTRLQAARWVSENL